MMKSMTTAKMKGTDCILV